MKTKIKEWKLAGKNPIDEFLNCISERKFGASL
jgi:hypothetical protein